MSLLQRRDSEIKAALNLAILPEKKITYLRCVKKMTITTRDKMIRVARTPIVTSTLAFIVESPFNVFHPANIRDINHYDRKKAIKRRFITLQKTAVLQTNCQRVENTDKGHRLPEPVFGAHRVDPCSVPRKNILHSESGFALVSSEALPQGRSVDQGRPRVDDLGGLATSDWFALGSGACKKKDVRGFIFCKGKIINMAKSWQTKNGYAFRRQILAEVRVNMRHD